ncbi:tyrosine-type recombinase/integrase [Aestuariibaculum sediminum]|uniref:Site-specific integrase n=1 Tax=Aestuariibaculum sediminum TaxID=2770637 RepID=A0A8J6U853_9FLAO|nr:site-specific integrase [Aestuariibaculum sediminum]MBD0832828.1 site-specific integrase [Aestuariibaculum sediminum]
MSNLSELLTFEYESEYESAYDLSLKRNFSAPKIYTANNDLSKRWYVYFSYRDPVSGRLKRQTPVYGEANKCKTKEDRMAILSVYRKVLLKLLKQGYSPYEDNKSLYMEVNTNKKASGNNAEKVQEKVPDVKSVLVKESILFEEAFAFGLKLKTKLINQTTKRSFENRLKNFSEWIKEFHPSVKGIHEVDKRLVIDFLNHMLEKTSARNRNNYRTDLSSIMQVLEDNDVVDSNFVKQIPILKTVPKRHKSYSNEEQESIFKYLEQEDPNLLLFIKFISYNFLRPIEVCRLRIKDIDIKNKQVKFQAKNSLLKTKIIPDVLFKELPDLSKLNKNMFLFTPEAIGGEWDTELTNKRDYYSKRFKKVVKDKFNLGKDYGLYSFRHTFITKLYRKMLSESSPFEAKSKLMLITGHTSMSALEKYLRDIDAELPADYSAMITS